MHEATISRQLTHYGPVSTDKTRLPLKQQLVFLVPVASIN